MDPNHAPGVGSALPVNHGFFGTHLFDVGKTSVTVGSIVAFGAILLFAWLVSAIIQRATLRALRLKGVTDEGSAILTRRLIHYAIIVIGLAVGLQAVGINLATLFAAGALFAVGIGFATQNITQNFVSGLILMIERTIKPGDVLIVEGVVVRVVKMGIRATIVRSRDEEEMIVPNATLVQSTVTNYTLRDSLLRLRAKVGVIYGSDMAVVRRVLEETAAAIPWRLQDRDPLIHLTEFGDNAVNYEVCVWTDDPWGARRQLSELHEAIWWALRKAGITIAFPQLDVHLDPNVVSALARSR